MGAGLADCAAGDQAPREVPLPFCTAPQSEGDVRAAASLVPPLTADSLPRASALLPPVTADMLAGAAAFTCLAVFAVVGDARWVCLSALGGGVLGYTGAATTQRFWLHTKWLKWRAGCAWNHACLSVQKWWHPPAPHVPGQRRVIPRPGFAGHG